jgi:hypothetical protein
VYLSVTVRMKQLELFLCNFLEVSHSNSFSNVTGDTGGPIVVPGTNVQIGLASWNLGCSGTDTPGVYARVDTAFSWIEQTICTDGFHTDACTADGKLPAVGVDGVALEQSCDDVADFVGHGKKLKTRDCAWVGLRPDRRCQWYGENYCPATCLVDRCKIP